jgi:hypothetical protein
MEAIQKDDLTEELPEANLRVARLNSCNLNAEQPPTFLFCLSRGAL